ncbi:hypothetical protein RRG08_029154 [Elysia crispata]|uniref:Uncharacterized protein n=1 Tax=Elysia crispata TaxID=231223 RepID=A0AAE1CTJ6_9GAST|nr:hypothetical protein RRG08_029154 [Elysia crispata]
MEQDMFRVEWTGRVPYIPPTRHVTRNLCHGASQPCRIATLDGGQVCLVDHAQWTRERVPGSAIALDNEEDPRLLDQSSRVP